MGRPITVTVGPLATADADGVTLSQKAASVAQHLAINGALTDGQTANNIAQSQTPAGAGTLTLNGSLASGSPAVAYLGQNRRIYFTFAGNESARTITIAGTYQTPQGLVFQGETLVGGNATIKSSEKQYYTITSITVDAAFAGAVTVGRSGLATFDVARRVIITSGGNDTGITFTLVGTDVNGSRITEAVTGASGAAASSTLSYKTLISVRASGAVATTVTVGTNGVADSPWVRFDDYAAHAEVAIQATVTGAANYTIQQTMQDTDAAASQDNVAPASIAWVNHPDSAVVAASSTQQANYAYTPIFAKVVLNSGTGSVSTVFRQVFTGH